MCNFILRKNSLLLLLICVSCTSCLPSTSNFTNFSQCRLVLAQKFHLVMKRFARRARLSNFSNNSSDLFTRALLSLFSLFFFFYLSASPSFPLHLCLLTFIASTAFTFAACVPRSIVSFAFAVCVTQFAFVSLEVRKWRRKREREGRECDTGSSHL